MLYWEPTADNEIAFLEPGALRWTAWLDRYDEHRRLRPQAEKAHDAGQQRYVWPAIPT